MYVLRYRKYPDSSHSGSATLTEITKAQFHKFCQAPQPGNLYYDPVDVTYAHAWVRNGGHHDTPLYVDQGRVRRARDAS